MALNIKTVKISFSRIGITTSNTPRRVCYLPMATIKYMDAKRKQKQEFLTGASLGDMDSCVILQKKRKNNLKRTTNDTKREHNQY